MGMQQLHAGRFVLRLRTKGRPALYHATLQLGYKEEDWVVDWWRKQPDANVVGWAGPFLDVVEQVCIMTITSAMVERLWSIYNASTGSHGHQFGPGELQKRASTRFTRMACNCRSILASRQCCISFALPRGRSLKLRCSLLSNINHVIR